MQTFLLGCDLYGRDEALAFARVLGWAATRVMEAARVVTADVAPRLDPEAWSTDARGLHDLRGVGEKVQLSAAARRAR